MTTALMEELAVRHPDINWGAVLAAPRASRGVTVEALIASGCDAERVKSIFLDETLDY